MKVIQVRNVNYALEIGVKYLRDHGTLRESRNGPVLVSPVPVTTVYERPQERVLFLPERDANPFFHLVESLWMLAGRNDLAVLTPYVARMKDFSDDGGKTQPGAYGKRWRKFFGIYGPYDEQRDQLAWAIRRLRADPHDRRVIIQMYDAMFDQYAADKGGKDIPCNIVCAPWIDVEGKLSMSIFCRSNDIVLGAYGANAVHFSVMQEYLAYGIGVEIGSMYQISNNYHAYLDTIEKVPEVMTLGGTDPYATEEVFAFPMFDDSDELKHFDEDLTIFFDDPQMVGFRSHFLRRVAAPMVLAHQAYRKKTDPERFDIAQEILRQCTAPDWRLAGLQWLGRRQATMLRAADDGVKHD